MHIIILIHVPSTCIFAKSCFFIFACVFMFSLFFSFHLTSSLFSKPFRTPALLIMGDQDHAFIKDTIRFCKINPATKLEVIPHCGHLSNIEKYKEFNTSALKFLLNQIQGNVNRFQVFHKNLSAGCFYHTLSVRFCPE